MKLNYTLETVEERLEVVQKILEENPNPSEKYLEILSDYLVIPIEKKERKERYILTENRLSTINKRETSLEGLTEQLENGEDGIYNIMNESKVTLLQPKVSITKSDLEEIPLLAQLRDSINRWEALLPHATGRDAYIIKKTLIEMRKDQYLIKNAYRKPIVANKLVRSHGSIKLDESYKIKGDSIITSGFTLCDPKICQIILCNYSRLKQESYGEFKGDTYYLMEDFDRLATKALQPYPMYERIVECKVDGLPNTDIQLILIKEFNKTHSIEYISSLWRNKIPNLIAVQAENELLNWHYLEVEKGKYKKCSRCGQIKLAHNKYFSKNKTSKDGWYSICKACRSKRKEKQNG